MNAPNIPVDSFEFIAMCQALDDHSLQTLHDQLSTKIVGIQIQLDASSSLSNSELWKHRARTSLKWNTWRLLTVKQIQSSKQRKQHSEYLKSYASQFVEVAKHLLDPDTFQVIHEQVKVATSNATVKYDKVTNNDANHPT